VGDHTPGPWHVGTNGRDIYGEDGEAVAFSYSRNVTLIAAAPDLLAALEQIAAIEPVGDFEVHRAVGIARAAIAKAKGPDIVAP
jgi:hypothetical protein